MASHSRRGYAWIADFEADGKLGSHIGCSVLPPPKGLAQLRHRLKAQTVGMRVLVPVQDMQRAKDTSKRLAESDGRAHRAMLTDDQGQRLIARWKAC
jgi:hypothetical protein